MHTIAFEKSIFYKARQLGQFGKTFIVHENNHDVMASAVNISDIFTNILSNAGGVSLQKFHQEQKISDESNLVSGNFVVEESLRKNLWVQISSPDQDDIEYFELTNPTGKVFQFPKFEHGLVYFRLAGLQEPGIWSYQARLFRKVKFNVNNFLLDIVKSFKLAFCKDFREECVILPVFKDYTRKNHNPVPNHKTGYT